MDDSSSPEHPTIPPGRAKAFHDAVRFYAEWRGDEPHVSLDLEPVLISAATQTVLPFRDPLPESVFERLFSYLHAEQTTLRAELDADPTYATAARCFLKLIEIRKAEIKRREEVASQVSVDPRLAAEFFEAVREYIRWSFSDSEPSMVDRHLVRISLVCGRLNGYTDPLPDDVFDAVEFMLADRRRKAELRANPTYDTAARFFQEAIELKKQGIGAPHS
jgi:hypothetical protein